MDSPPIITALAESNMTVMRTGITPLHRQSKQIRAHFASEIKFNAFLNHTAASIVALNSNEANEG